MGDTTVFCVLAPFRVWGAVLASWLIRPLHERATAAASSVRRTLQEAWRRCPGCRSDRVP